MALHHSPHISTDGLILYLDAANPNGLNGTTFYDLSGNNKHHTIVDNPSFATNPPGFVLNGTSQGFSYTGQITLSTNCTVIIFYKSSDNTDLWVKGNTTGFYLAASYPGSGYYSAACGTPSYYIDLNVVLDPLSPINYKDNKYHMWEAKNVDFSTWTLYEWFLYYAGYQTAGTVSSLLVYDRNLTSDESKQNYRALKGRFGL